MMTKSTSLDSGKEGPGREQKGGIAEEMKKHLA